MIDLLFSNLEMYTRFLMFLLVIVVSKYIYLKANKLYKLSNYKGLKIFSLAFLYFALAYTFNFFIALTDLFLINYNVSTWVNYIYFLFYYFISMAGLMLVYSLVWKDFEAKVSSFLGKILSKRYVLLHLVGLVMGITSLYRPEIMFMIILVLLLYAIILSYSNYVNSKLKLKKDFSQLYFITMILAFLGYLINFLPGFFPYIEIYVYLGTIVIFVLFLYGALKFNK